MKYPIGIQSFDRIIEDGYVYIDKTDLIYKLVTEGKIYFEDFDTEELWKDELADIRRRKIGFVFQDYYLMDSLTVRENIILPMILDKADSAEMKKRAEKYAEQFEISHLLDKKPTELSGGEKRRLMLAVLFAIDPMIFVLDESFDELSADWRQRLVEFINKSKRTTSSCPT